MIFGGCAEQRSPFCFGEKELVGTRESGDLSIRPQARFQTTTVQISDSCECVLRLCRRDLRKASEAVNFLKFSCIFLLTCYSASYTFSSWDTYRECS